MGKVIRLPMQYRRPAQVWIPLGLMVAPIVGAIPFSLLFSAVVTRDFSLFGAYFSITYSWVAALSLLAAMIVGFPWALLTRNLQRRGVGDVVFESFIVALVFLAGLTTAWAAWMVVEAQPDHRLSFAATVLDVAQVTGVFAVFAVLIVPVAGVVLSSIAFVRPTSPETRPLSTP